MGEESGPRRANGYYDGGLIRITDVEVPAKRVGYKKQGDTLVASVPFGAKHFEASVREAYADNANPMWPMKGRLFVAIGIAMPKSAFGVTDVDNLAKTLLDAFCGVAYHDDKQVESLFINKSVDSCWSVWIGLHTITDQEAPWVVQPVLLQHNGGAP